MRQQTIIRTVLGLVTMAIGTSHVWAARMQLTETGNKLEAQYAEQLQTLEAAKAAFGELKKTKGLVNHAHWWINSAKGKIA